MENIQLKIKEKLHREIIKIFQEKKEMMKNEISAHINVADYINGASSDRRLNGSIKDQNNLLDQYISELNEVNDSISFLLSHKVISQSIIKKGAIIVIKNIKSGMRTNFYIFKKILKRPIFVDDLKFLFLNINSPLGAALHNKNKNDKIIFNQIEYLIEDVS